MISWTATVSSLLASCIVYFLYRLYNVRRFYKDLPKPPHSFLWGHLKIMGEVVAMVPPKAHPQIYYTTIARKYDLQGIWYLDLWPIGPSQVILTDPDLMDEIQVRRAYPQHRMSAEFLAPMIGDKVIAVVNGPTWKALHSAMSPAFSWSHIRSLTDMIVDQCEYFRNTLDRFAKSGEAFSMEETATKLIFDVIAQIVYNFPLHAQTKGSQMLDDLREMIELANINLDLANQLNPWVQIKTFFRRRELLGRLHPEVIGQIKDRFDLLLKDKIMPSRKNPTSILDLMLRERVRDVEGNVEKGKTSDFTAEEMELLIHNIKGLLVGGHGTTTDTLCFIYMLLTTSPQTTAALIEEHTRVLGSTTASTIQSLITSPDLLQSLPYTNAVIKETLRLFPVGFTLRQSPSLTSTLAYNSQTYPIPSTLAIVLNLHDTHYNPAYYPSPATFTPARWLDEAEAIPRAYFRTFSHGARACMGQNLAMNELKIVLVLTLRRYVFRCERVVPNEKPRVQWTALDTVLGDAVFQELGLEARPRGGVWMSVKRRGREECGEE